MNRKCHVLIGRNPNWSNFHCCHLDFQKVIYQCIKIKLKQKKTKKKPHCSKFFFFWFWFTALLGECKMSVFFKVGNKYVFEDIKITQNYCSPLLLHLKNCMGSRYPHGSLILQWLNFEKFNFEIKSERTDLK